MGLRFRKSFKIAPGVRLKMGKQGLASVRIGARGAGVNIGKKGTRASAGIPGTGVGYSHKISDAGGGLVSSLGFVGLFAAVAFILFLLFG